MVVIGGGGAAGLTGAAGAAPVGARVALLERGAMGGECLNTGCVPSEALLHVARVAQLVRTAPDHAISGARALSPRARQRRPRHSHRGRIPGRLLPAHGAGGIPDWSFYLAFAIFRIAAISQGIMGRVIAGAANDPNARLRGERVAAGRRRLARRERGLGKRSMIDNQASRWWKATIAFGAGGGAVVTDTTLIGAVTGVTAARMPRYRCARRGG